MSEIAMKITGDDKSAQAALARLDAKVLSLESKLKGVGQSGRKSGDDLSGGMDKVIGSLAGMAGGFLTVGTAIGAVNRATETWLQNIRESTQAADKLIPSLKPLLSGGGRMPTEETMRIVARAGINDRPAALGLADALEDAMGGDTKSAQRELKEVLDVSRLGDLSLENIKELATAAAGFSGKDVGQVIRQVQLVSQRYKVSPETISKTLAIHERIGSPEDALAFTAMMQSKLPGRKAIGGIEGVLEALGPEADDKMQRKFRRVAGVRPNQSLFEQLERFAVSGVDTMEEFTKLGAKVVTAQNLSFAVQGLGKMRAVIAELGGPASTEAAIIGQIGRMEMESPEVRAARERAQIEGEQETGLVFGPTAVRMNEDDRRRLIAGRALRRMGLARISHRGYRERLHPVA